MFKDLLRLFVYNTQQAFPLPEPFAEMSLCTKQGTWRDRRENPVDDGKNNLNAKEKNILDNEDFFFAFCRTRWF